MSSGPHGTIFIVAIYICPQILVALVTYRRGKSVSWIGQFACKTVTIQFYKQFKRLPWLLLRAHAVMIMVKMEALLIANPPHKFNILLENLFWKKALFLFIFFFCFTFLNTVYIDKRSVSCKSFEICVKVFVVLKWLGIACLEKAFWTLTKLLKIVTFNQLVIHLNFNCIYMFTK